MVASGRARLRCSSATCSAPMTGTFFRGDGEWGSSTRGAGPRAELWHLQKMYSPIERRRCHHSVPDDVTLTVRNRFSHLGLDRLDGVEPVDGVGVGGGPGCGARCRADHHHPAAQGRRALGAGRVPPPRGLGGRRLRWAAPEKNTSTAVPGGAESAGHRMAGLPCDERRPPGHPAARCHSSAIRRRLPVERSASTGSTGPARYRWRSTTASRTFDYDVVYTGIEELQRPRGRADLHATAGTHRPLVGARRRVVVLPARRTSAGTGATPTPNPRAFDVQKPTPTWEDDGSDLGSVDYRSAKRQCAGPASPTARGRSRCDRTASSPCALTSRTAHRSPCAGLVRRSPHRRPGASGVVGVLRRRTADRVRALASPARSQSRSAIFRRASGHESRAVACARRRASRRGR